MNPTKRFYFDARTQEIIESITIPFAIYQYIDKRVVTIALSQGFCSEFGFKKLEDAYSAMDNDMYRATHPDIWMFFYYCVRLPAGSMLPEKRGDYKYTI